jgi:hypothetical protein
MRYSVRIPLVLLLVLLAVALPAPAALAQQTDVATRDRNRDQLVELLRTAGPVENMTFTQNKGQPYDYTAFLRTGLTHAESFEVVFGVTNVNSYSMRAYPHYKGGYINVDKVKNPVSLMRQLLVLSNRSFLFWGIDSSGDVFTAFTITLESGFPADAIRVVLNSIARHDTFIGELRSAID